MNGSSQSRIRTGWTNVYASAQKAGVADLSLIAIVLTPVSEGSSRNPSRPASAIRSMEQSSRSSLVFAGLRWRGRYRRRLCIRVVIGASGYDILPPYGDYATACFGGLSLSTTTLVLDTLYIKRSNIELPQTSSGIIAIRSRHIFTPKRQFTPRIQIRRLIILLVNVKSCKHPVPDSAPSKDAVSSAR